MNKLLLDTLSVFMVLFAVIDIVGSIPIILKFKKEGLDINPFKITSAALIILIIFMFAGKGILGLFGVDISSFAIAGALVIFVLSFEMIFGVTIFKHETPKSASIVPLAFPIIAGAGSITTLISLRAVYSMYSILLALFLNMVVVFIVLKLTNKIERIIGETTIHILKKVFGVILLAIAIKLFLTSTGIELPQ